MAWRTAQTMFAGVRLICRRPLDVVAWSAAAIAVNVVYVTVLVLVVPSIRSPAPMDLASMLLVAGLLILFALIALSLPVAAVYRALLRDEAHDRRFAGLRLGPDELRIMAVGVALLVLTFAFWLFSVVLAALLRAPAEVFAFGPVRYAVELAIWAVFWLAAAWLWVRLSLVGPATFADRRFRLGSAWRLTRGRFWSLAAAYLVSALIALFLLVLFAVAGGLLATALGLRGVPRGLDWADLLPWMIAVASIGPAAAIAAAPAAVAYRAVAPGVDVSDTYA